MKAKSSLKVIKILSFVYIVLVSPAVLGSNSCCTADSANTKFIGEGKANRGGSKIFDVTGYDELILSIKKCGTVGPVKKNLYEVYQGFDSKMGTVIAPTVACQGSRMKVLGNKFQVVHKCQRISSRYPNACIYSGLSFYLYGVKCP